MRKKILNRNLYSVIILMMVLFLEYSYFYFGSIFNEIFVCSQNPLNAFPCHYQYDAYFMIFLGLMIIIILSRMVYKIIKKIKFKRIKN